MEQLLDLKTPCYIINKAALDEGLNKLNQALRDHWNHYRIGYSFKTNALPWVVQYFLNRGCYAEVVSEEEYELGKLLGAAADHFLYNGPIKSRQSFLEAAQNGCIINIDAARELDWLEDLPKDREYQFGLRVNFDIESMCPGQSQCPEEGGRFGFCYENGELEKAIARMNKAGVRLSGLHLHTSSKSRSPEIYDSIAKMAVEITEKYHLDLDFVDVGGGFFGGLPTKPQFDEYISRMAAILKTAFSPERTMMIVEPGMCLIGAPISYCSTVIDVKDTSFSRFVVTDGTRTSIDPLMSKTGYFHSFLQKQPGKIHPRQIICGYTCMEHDRLFVAKDGPELAVGDRIVYDKVGAYTMCLTPLFIKYFPDVYVLENETYRKVRTAWTPTEYVQNCVGEEL